MIDRQWFTPSEGLTIPHPVTGTVVPAKGTWVRRGDEFFIRRELDGDGTLADEAPIGADSE